MLYPDLGGDAKRVLAALKAQFQYLELAPDGRILTANPLYCEVIGHDLASIKGKPHSVLVAPAYADSPEYKEFLAKIARGESFTHEARRTGKSGREKWFHAVYGPIFGRGGKLLKVVAVGFEISAAKSRAVEDFSLLEAITREMTVLELALDGKILTPTKITRIRWVIVWRISRVSIIGRSSTPLTPSPPNTGNSGTV